MAITFTFGDLKRRNDIARDQVKERLFLLERKKDDENGKLTPAEENELKLHEALTTGKNKKKVLDPLFFGLRSALELTNPEMGQIDEHTDGRFGKLDRKEKLFVALYGLLSADNQQPRDFEWALTKQGKPEFSTGDARFQKAVAGAVGEYTANAELFDETLDTMRKEGGGTIDAAQWASVVRALRARGITADHPNLALLTREVLADEVGASDGAAPSSIELRAPDLDDATDTVIVGNNIKPMLIFYPSWMLEEARFYDTYDKIEELFLNQMLPITRGSAGDRIYALWKKSTQRISKPERLNFYASCFGAPGGNPALANQNREFSDLWLRFVSGVSEWARKLQVDDLLRTRVPLSVSSEQVRKAARDLAANLSLHGYGVAYFAAAELQNEINAISDILKDEEVRMAYGARDMRQLIEQVSIYELGGARDVTRFFTMATSGAVIISWLVKKAPELSGSYLRPLLDINVVRQQSLRQQSQRASQDPNDRDLVDACEQWLAVTGTPDARVSEFAQPVETPAMTSRPIAIPQVARDMLDSVGISAGMGRPNGHAAKYAAQR
jgi:hypothetical protein